MMRERKKINAKFFEKKNVMITIFTCKNQNINYCNDYNNQTEP